MSELGVPAQPSREAFGASPCLPVPTSGPILVHFPAIRCKEIMQMKFIECMLSRQSKIFEACLSDDMDVSRMGG